MPNVSLTVAIPTYNNKQTISACLRSLKQQSYKDWVCLISDDFSSDGTVEKIQEDIRNDSRFKIIEQTKNLGPSKNWNFLLDRCRTSYFKLLHADDVLYQDSLFLTMKYLEKHPDISLLFGQRDISLVPNYENKTKIHRIKTTFYEPNQLKKIFLNSGKNFIGEPSFVTYKTQELVSSGGFSDSWQYLIDMDSYIKVTEKHGSLKIHQKLGCFRVSKSSWSQKLILVQYKEIIQFLKSLDRSGKIRIFARLNSFFRFLARNIYIYYLTLSQIARKKYN